MKSKELLQRYASGERDFVGAIILDAFSRPANLREAELSEVILRGAMLERATLVMATLARAVDVNRLFWRVAGAQNDNWLL